MNHSEWLTQQAHLTLERLQPRLRPLLQVSAHADIFEARLQEHFPTLFAKLFELYHDQYDFFYHIEQILITAIKHFVERPRELHLLDLARAEDPMWFQSEKMIGAVAYVDLLADDIASLRDKIPYLQELGITYLHLMPLFKSPIKNNDGGYAVSDYRTVNPDLGTMQQLAGFASELRQVGISLVLDFVFNHTSDEHAWARYALAGDEHYQGYYWMFPDRTMPDQYEATLREIFPDQSPGSFIYREEIHKWVWSSFYSFQWDLNYSNPNVFNAMLGEMLFLANQGVEFLRLDAVAFIWKQLGTSSENLPQAHTIIQAFNALTKIVCPTLLFKSEAIVHPDDVMSYIGWDESPISYNPTLMALLWEALATRNVTLLQHSMSRRFALPEDCAWVNYVRVHDDIGWTFADEDAGELRMNGYDHRQFLNRFYTGQFEGSFAMGLPFGYNPINKDMRICGTTASLAGLEQGLEYGDDTLVDHAVKRHLLLYSVAISVGGIPLLYMGDELAMLNDYSYRDDKKKRDDSRWVHRPHFDWQRASLRHDTDAISGRVFQSFKHMLDIRRRYPFFANESTTFFDTQNPHVLGYVRNQCLLVLANFSEHPQSVERALLSVYASLDDEAHDLITDNHIPSFPDTLTLEPYQFVWLTWCRD
jgi:amylosucrase